jgi:hypothetical protein
MSSDETWGYFTSLPHPEAYALTEHIKKHMAASSLINASLCEVNEQSHTSHKDKSDYAQGKEWIGGFHGYL